MSSKLKTIRQVCEITGATRRTLQHYDEIGLLTCPKKDSDGKWLYDTASIDRLREILILKECELSLREIRRIISLPENEKREVFKEKLFVLQKKRELLDQKILFLESIIDNSTYSNYLHFMKNIKPADIPSVMNYIRSSSDLPADMSMKIEQLFTDTQEPFLTDWNDILRRISLSAEKPYDSTEIHAAVSQLQAFINEHYGRCSGIDLIILSGALLAGSPIVIQNSSLNEASIEYISTVLMNSGAEIFESELDDIAGYLEKGYNALLSVVETILEENRNYVFTSDDISFREHIDLIDVSDPRIQNIVERADQEIQRYSAFCDFGSVCGIIRFLYENPHLIGNIFDDIDDDSICLGIIVEKALFFHMKNVSSSS